MQLMSRSSFVVSGSCSFAVMSLLSPPGSTDPASTTTTTTHAAGSSSSSTNPCATTVDLMLSRPRETAPPLEISDPSAYLVKDKQQEAAATIEVSLSTTQEKTRGSVSPSPSTFSSASSSSSEEMSTASLSSVSSTSSSSSASSRSLEGTASFGSDDDNEGKTTKKKTDDGEGDYPACRFHSPPPGYGENYYEDNDTVFGKILRGDLPASVLDESDRLLAFRDIHPRAPLHGLVITKRYVRSVFDLRAPSPSSSLCYGDDDDRNDCDEDVDDVRLLRHMKSMGLDIIREREPDAYARGDYRMVFHIPPFNSIDHIHMHVLAPVSRMSWFHRNVRYATGESDRLFDVSTYAKRFSAGVDKVLARLERGKSPVPYRYRHEKRGDKKKSNRQQEVAEGDDTVVASEQRTRQRRRQRQQEVEQCPVPVAS